ncbi:serine/threonine protein kinase [Methylosinus sporium]|uniref:non-specific serine/threonine protein kinase n=1 Tax=Methylosinus sporium TaxID=428 RepID=A0A2U1SR57_METSR|nr:protein kinase [Methylosinus sporium]PWB94098.1 protein kinase [Methylosinus sporium]
MECDADIWNDCPSWKNRWEVLQPLQGGAQGNAYKVRRKSDDRIAFLKSVKAPTHPERRARFFREASAYESFNVAGAPTLIESNAHRHKDFSFHPYIATTFIEGPTLRKWREEKSEVELETALALTMSLLNILRDCHAVGLIHRDVKPDNIILVQGAPDNVVLLDFGLNYHEHVDADFQTEHWQEVGNRFLRLPELSAGSYLKQDPRSDITFCAGILFYVLTGDHPAVLEDAEGRLPHQRGEAPSRLLKASGARLRRLLSLFDNAFEPKIANRLSSVEVMRDAVMTIMAPEDPIGSPENDLIAIRTVMNTQSERRRLESINRFECAIQEVWTLYKEVQNELEGTLALSQTGMHITSEFGRNTLFWSRRGSSDRVLSTTYEVLEAGDEIIIRMSTESVYRTPLAEPSYETPFRDAVRSWLLARLNSALR